MNSSLFGWATVACLLLATPSYAPDPKETDFLKRFLERIQDPNYESEMDSFVSDSEGFDQNPPFFQTRENELFWKAHDVEKKKYRKVQPDITPFRDTLLQDLARFESPASPPSTPPPYTYAQADLAARTVLRRRLTGPVDTAIRTDPTVRQFYNRFVNRLTQKTNPLAVASSPMTSTTRQQKTETPKTKKKDTDLEARQGAALEQWRQANTQKLQNQLDELVRTALTEIVTARPGVFSIVVPGQDPRLLTAAEIQNIHAEPGQNGSELEITWRGLSGGNVALDSGNPSEAVTFGDSIRQLLRLKQDRSTVERFAWASLRDADIRFVLELMSALRTGTPKQMIAEVRGIFLDHDYSEDAIDDPLDDFATIEFEDEKRRRKGARTRDSGAYSSGELSSSTTGGNPVRNRAVFKVTSHTGDFQPTADAYFRSGTPSLKAKDIQPAAPTHTLPVEQTVAAVRPITANSQGLISIPKRDGLVLATARVTTALGKKLEENKDYELAVGPSGESFIRLRGKKNLNTPLAIEADFAADTHHAPGDRPNPELDKAVLQAISENMKQEGLDGLGASLSALAASEGPVRLSMLGPLVELNTLYTFANKPPAQDAGTILLEKIFGRAPEELYGKFRHQLVAGPTGKTLALQCLDAARLLHTVLQDYSKRKPQAPIVSKIVTGNLATGNGSEQLLHEVEHAWVEAGELNAPPLRLDPTPSLMDPKSPKPKARPEVGVFLTAQQRIAYDHEQAAQETWARISREMQESAERLNEVIERQRRDFRPARQTAVRLSNRNHPYMQVNALISALHHLQSTGDTEQAIAVARNRLGFRPTRATTGRQLVSFLAEKSLQLTQFRPAQLQLQQINSKMVTPQSYYSLAQFAMTEAQALDSRLSEGTNKLNLFAAPPDACAVYLSRIKKAVPSK